MPGVSPFLQSLMMLATLVLALGGVRLVRRRDSRRRGILMLVAAAVILIDVLLITVPL